jgi:hypothetical protein
MAYGETNKHVALPQEYGVAKPLIADSRYFPFQIQSFVYGAG